LFWLGEWGRQQLTATEPDILRFPMSVLAAAAIIAGLEVSLLFKYKAEDEEIRWRVNYTAKRRLRGSGPVLDFGRDMNDKVKVKQRDARRLVFEMLPIVEDLKLLLDLNDVRGGIHSVKCCLTLTVLSS
jgi:hypothetical protein